MLTDGCGTTDHPGQTHFTKRTKSNSPRLLRPFALDSCVLFSPLLVRVGGAGTGCPQTLPGSVLQTAQTLPHVSFHPCLSSLDVDVQLVGLEELFRNVENKKVWTKKNGTVARKHPELVKCCDLSQDRQRFVALWDSCSAASGSLWESGFADADIMSSARTLVPIQNVPFSPCVPILDSSLLRLLFVCLVNICFTVLLL